MYGTIARIQVKRGMEAEFKELEQEYSTAPMPGFVVTYVYQMDADPNEFYLAVAFATKEAYVANANSPEQHQTFLQMMKFLESEPEWHDGIVAVEWRDQSPSV